MFRLTILTFEGGERFDHRHVQPHEAPQTMTIPLIVLAGLSIVGGFVGIPESLMGGNALEQWLEPIFAPALSKLRVMPHHVEVTEYILMILSVGIALAGIYGARWVYLRRQELSALWQQKYARIYTLLWNKYYVDEAYDALFVRPTVRLSNSLLWKGLDVAVIDRMVNGTASAVAWCAFWIRRVQTGVAQMYATVLVGGIVVILFWLLIK
jgi:NADH-quinone oxidoreductase subunit L